MATQVSYRQMRKAHALGTLARTRADLDAALATPGASESTLRSLGMLHARAKLNAVEVGIPREQAGYTW